MNQFTETDFTVSPTAQAAASTPTQLIRKQEYDARLSDIDSAIAALQSSQSHDPVTLGASQSLNLALNDQELSGEVKLISDTVIQAAGAALTKVFDDPVAANDTLDLEKLQVSEIIVIRREAGGGATLATGEDGTDYFLDAADGLLVIAEGSSLITAVGEEVFVTFDCALIKEGPGAQVTASGLTVSFGGAHHQVARGDHEHANDHKPLTTEDTESIEMSVNLYQKVSAALRIADTSLTVGMAGVQVNTTVIATKQSVDTLEARVEALESGSGGDDTVISVQDTDTLDLTITNGTITGDVKYSIGLRVGEDGLEVDFDTVAAINHTHALATNSSDGFMSSEHVEALDAMDTAITALESGQAEQDDRMDGLDTAIAAKVSQSEYDTFVQAVESGQAVQDAAIEEKADIDDVNTALAGKAAIEHTHPISEITGLQGELDGKAPLARVAHLDSRDFDGQVNDILVTADSVFVVGNFTKYGQYVAPKIAKLNHRGKWDALFKSAAGFSIAPIKLARAAGAVIAAGPDADFGSTGTARPVWKIKDDGTRDTGFTCPSAVSTVGSDEVLAIAMFGTKVAIITARQLIILTAAGAVETRLTGDDQMNAVLAHGTGLLVTSHAYTAADSPHSFNAWTSPKGAKLLTAALALDSTWSADNKGGTGAQSSCGEAVLGHDGSYFIIGNARSGFNSPSTAWNAELIGNLLLWSEQFDNAAWTKVGALTVTANDEDDPDNNPTADKLEDTNAAQHAYVYQDVAVADNTDRYVFSAYVKKDAVTNRFPLFRLQLTDGTTEVDYQVQLNTSTGATQVISNVGGGAGTVAVEDATTYWRIRLAASNTAVGNTTLRATIYPAYADTIGGSSESLTGYIHAWGAQVRKDAWNNTYQQTEGDQFEPDNQGSNSNRFRGLYKIGTDGEEDPTFDCRIELNSGHVKPFFTDADGYIYIGGDISAIYDAGGAAVAVTANRLYRLTPAGKFDAEFDDFNGTVSVARLVGCGRIAVGGAFTAYGHRDVGYFLFISPDGEALDLYGDEDSNVIPSDEEPDVAADPCLKTKLWLDLSDPCPPDLKVWDDCLEQWVSVGTPNLPCPTFDPVDGSPNAEEVTLTMPGYAGVAIYYTLDGSDPTGEDGILYTGPIELTESVTVKAYGRLAGHNDGPVCEASYVVVPKLPCPLFQPGDGATTPNLVTLSVTGHPDATIYYTTDGSTPTTSSSVYSSPIAVNDETTIKAFATKTGYRDSNICEADYAPADYGQTLPEVEFDPVDGTAGEIPMPVSMFVTGHPNVLIYYTTDGSTPTYQSAQYTPGVSDDVLVADTIKAFATELLWNPSEVSEASYTQAQVPTPTISPNGGAVTLNSTFTLACSLAGASIYYTTDGSTPTESSTLYSGPVALSSLPVTIKAKAFKTGYLASNVASADFTQLQVATPEFSPAAGTQTLPVDVTITCATSGAAIYYTTDGSTPDTGDTLYTAPVTISTDLTLKAIAVKSGYLDSAVASGYYTNDLQAPSISPANGSAIPDQQLITLSQSGNPVGTEIRYTVDGSTPDETDQLYSVPFAIQHDMTVKAICVKSGYSNSAVTSASYTHAQVPTPTANPAAGGVPFPTDVALSCSLSGATIHYTTDGSTPDSSDPVYSSPITVNADTTIKAMARKAGYLDSAVLTAAYTQAQLAAPVITPSGGDYPMPLLISSITALAGATIRYTLDGTDPDSGDEVYDPTLRRNVIMTSNTTPSGSASATGGSAGAWNAFDGSTTNGLAAAFDPFEVTQELAVAAVFTKWSLNVNIHSGILQTVTVYGSNNGTDWTELSSINGNWSSPQTITVGESFANATAYTFYKMKLDMNAPNGSIIKEIIYYLDPLYVDGDPVTLKAYAAKSGYLDSAVASETYNKADVATPVANPAGGGIAFPTNVTLTCATSGAAIYYTTDGSTPTEASTLYSGPVSVGSALTLKAKAFKTGYNASAVMSESYTQQQIVVSFDPVTGSTGVTQVEIEADVAGSTIYYTLDGSTPDETSFVYSGPIAISGATTVKALAVKSGYIDSAVGTALYNGA